MKNKHVLFAACMAFMVGIGLISCNKSSSDQTAAPPAGKQNVSLYLTDGPGVFDKVLVDIRSVKVLIDTTPRRHDNEDWDHQGEDEDRNRNGKDSVFVWQTLNITPGVYDILRFRNGADTLLASSNIPKGNIRLIKIEIGTNNSVTKNGVSYPLYLPSNSRNYVLLKLRGHEFEEYVSDKKRLWLDFDVQRSIFQESDNRFYLRPIFHFYVVSNTGSVAGTITPREAYPVVTLYNSTDTAYALPDKEGNFKIRGVKDGRYSVFINASNGYRDSTITNVSVTSPRETSIGTIALHK